MSQTGLRPSAEATERHAFSQVREYRVGPGQSQHPHRCVPLPGVPTRRSAAHRQPLRVALHAETRQSAQHGERGTIRPGPAMPCRAHSQYRKPWRTSLSLAAAAQRTPYQNRLAVCKRRRPYQAEKLIPCASDEPDYQRTMGYTEILYASIWASGQLSRRAALGACCVGITVRPNM